MSPHIQSEFLDSQYLSAITPTNDKTEKRLFIKFFMSTIIVVT